ncbi:hypothetical protein ACH3XW_15730 [Acanthocheilonema viteae]
MFLVLILFAYIVNDTFGVLCPPIFGQFECPLNFTCVTNECYTESNAIASYNCEEVKCNANFRCYKGRCYSIFGLSCDRNIELSEYKFRSITSNCGLKGKCINGRCVEDRCHGIECTENELCQDGKCLIVNNTFCITHFDCGPTFKCFQNKCISFRDPISCNCDPGCTHVSCEMGSFCFKGTCQTAVGQDCTSTPCQGSTICVEGRCILNPCINRCPPDHACREGQCRHLEGLLCYEECPKPYVCIDGRCTRNECFGKSCQPGEICQFGLCIKVEGRLCSLAIRDCAEEFECIGGICHDLLVAEDNITLS